MSKQQCGYVAIIGRPNVGKSTLLNRLLGQKISITCRKPQTTRHQILGIKTEGDVQAIYVDTPGIHRQQRKALNRYMNKAATSIVHDVNVIVWVIDEHWTDEENYILERLGKTEVPVILALNKVDKVKDKKALLPQLKVLYHKMSFADVIPISAKQGTQLDELEKSIAKHLPEEPFVFGEEEVTDRSMKFLSAEIIREKLMRNLGEELPYALAVEIEIFKDDPAEEQVYIAANIFIERASQKPIIIGKGGEKLKEIGREARLDIKELMGKRVHLELWVKIKQGWSDDERALRSLGYE
jgi:GTP-binding protein Era